MHYLVDLLGDEAVGVAGLAHEFEGAAAEAGHDGVALCRRHCLHRDHLCSVCNSSVRIPWPCAHLGILNNQLSGIAIRLGMTLWVRRRYADGLKIWAYRCHCCCRFRGQCCCSRCCCRSRFLHIQNEDLGTDHTHRMSLAGCHTSGSSCASKELPAYGEAITWKANVAHTSTDGRT